MKEVDGETFVKQKLGLVIGSKALSIFNSKKSLEDVLEMTEITGNLESDEYNYSIKTVEGESISIAEREMFLKDPDWDYAVTEKDEKRLNKKIMERFGNKEAIWYGQMTEKGLLLYMIHVKESNDPKKDKFYYSGMIGLTSAIIEKKFGIELPIPNEYRKYSS